MSPFITASRLAPIHRKSERRAMNVRHLAMLITLTALTLLSSAARSEVFVMPGTIGIPEGPGPAAPYPSSLSVDELSGDVVQARVTLRAFQHLNPDDVGVLLVGPSGQRIRLMTDSGAMDPFDLGELDPAPISWITFSTQASAFLPDVSPSITTGIPSGSYLPTLGTSGPGQQSNPHATEWPFPAPVGPHGSSLTPLLGPAAQINGVWSLYVDDDTAGAYGQIVGGWELEFITVPSATAPSVALGATVTLNGGSGSLPVEVLESGRSPGRLSIDCSIPAGAAQFQLLGGAQREVSAPATLGPLAQPILLACVQQAAESQAMLRCSQSTDPASTRGDLTAVVVCPAAAPSPQAPAASLPAKATLLAGTGGVTLEATSAGVAPGSLSLSCSIPSGAANFRITGNGARSLNAPTSIGPLAPQIGLSCDPQPLPQEAILRCAQSAVPTSASADLTSRIVCPAAVQAARAPAVSVPAQATLADGQAIVPVTVEDAGVASGDLRLTCAVSSPAGNFQLSEAGTRVIAAPAPLGPIAAGIAVACTRQVAGSAGVLQCTQATTPDSVRTTLSVALSCPGHGGTADGVSARVVPTTVPSNLILLALLVGALAAAALRTRP
jgi:hypothetical protein